MNRLKKKINATQKKWLIKYSYIKNKELKDKKQYDIVKE